MTKRKSSTRRLRVVLDTNVYISALIFSTGSLGAIIEQAKLRTYQPVMSPYIIAEFTRKLREKFSVPEARVEDYKRLLVHFSELVVPHDIPMVIPHDPDDNNILACAETGNADLIVSGDRDLLDLKEYSGIPIERPKDFVRSLGGLQF